MVGGRSMDTVRTAAGAHLWGYHIYRTVQAAAIESLPHTLLPTSVFEWILHCLETTSQASHPLKFTIVNAFTTGFGFLLFLPPAYTVQNQVSTCSFQHMQNLSPHTSFPMFFPQHIPDGTSQPLRLAISLHDNMREHERGTQPS